MVSYRPQRILGAVDEPPEDPRPRKLGRLPPLVPKGTPIPPKYYRWERDFPQGIYTEEDIEEMLAKLSANQVTYADCLIRGYSKGEAAVRSGAAYATCAQWEQTPWWESLLERRRKQYYGDKDTVFLPLMPAAVERLKHELTGEAGDQLAHDSMLEVFRRVWGQPTQQKIVERRGDAEGTLADLATVLRAAFSANEQLKDEHRRLLAGDDDPVTAVIPVEATIREVSDYARDSSDARPVA